MHSSGDGPSQNLHCNPPYHMRHGGAGRPAITEAELCADDVGEEDSWWEFGHKHVSLPFPKTICMRIQRLPSVSTSPVPLCSTIPPITHTLLATSVAGLYYWHRPTTGGRWGCCAVIYDIQIQRLL